ncbi:hypothetical protein [Foetidibacter luteolus]|uniref:hypothetical protein n=1 Tax=Foetidibacter luteolus TaxID=2608880 RepID=UPI00129BFFA9|nr:hypothetical protein [Foetidibacter luteolus]
MQKQKCKHPTCGDTCRRETKPRKTYVLKRSPIERKPYKIRRYSLKRSKVNKTEYSPKAKQYIIDNPLCNIQSPVCTYFSQCVNHRKGKQSIELLLDETYWEPSCIACNNWIEEHDAWARERGHKLSQHAISNNTITNE